MEDSNSIRIAIAGAGAIGTVHARNIAAHPDCTLSHVIDLDAERAERLSGRFGGKTGSTIEAATRDEEVDAVIIASSTAAHTEQVLACTEAQMHFLCEKPIADGLEQAKECLKRVEDAGVVSAMGFNRRPVSEYRALSDRTRSGKIGKVESLHVVSRTSEPPNPETAVVSGGMIREKGAHFYDLASWIPGHEPVEVHAAGAGLIDPAFAEYGDMDTAALTLCFDSGAIVTFSFGRRTVYGQDELIEVFGSDGMLISGRQRAGDVALFKGRTVVESGIHFGWYDRFRESYALELNSFVSAIVNRTPVHASLADGLRTQAVAEAAIHSLKRGAPVRMEKIW